MRDVLETSEGEVYERGNMWEAYRRDFRVRILGVTFNSAGLWHLGVPRWNSTGELFNIICFCTRGTPMVATHIALYSSGGTHVQKQMFYKVNQGCAGAKF